MTPEQDFIKSVKDYFNDPELIDDKAERRVLYLLGKFKEETKVETVIKVEYRDIVREKVIIRHKPVYMDKENIVKPIMPPCSPQELEKEGRDFCNEMGINYFLFRKSESFKTNCIMTSHRRKFCFYIIGKYTVSNKELADYFSVTHASITNYFKPKKSYQKFHNIKEAV